MLKGVLIAFGIMLASIPIPIVHFITLPISPYIAGFIGGGVAKADEGKITVFGFIVGGLMLIPSAVILILGLGFDVKLFGLDKLLVAIVAGVLPFYAWYGVTLGAFVSYLLRRKEQKNSVGKGMDSSGS